MRKNSKNEKVIRAMAIGISAMLMASSPLTALAAEGEGNSSEGNEDKNITVTPEAGVCDQAEAAAKDADKAVEGAEKSAADVKAEVVDKVAAGDVKDAECEFPYKSRVMPTSEPLKTLKAPYMARNTMKWGFFRLKSQ